MPKSIKFPTWEEYAGESGKLEYKFSWDDDHSSWRLEELSEDIKKAEELLYKVGYLEKLPDGDALDRYLSIYDISHLPKELKKAIRDEKIDDSTAREMFLLGEVLFFPQDIMGDDSQMAFQDEQEMILDAIRIWSKNFPLAYSEEESDIDPEDLFISLNEDRYHRNFGDRWKVTITAGEIDFNGLVLVKGIKSSPHILDILNTISEDPFFDSSKSIFDIIELLKVKEENELKEIRDLIFEMAQGIELSLEIELFLEIEKIYQEYGSLKKIIDYSKSLVSEWTLSPRELLLAIVNL